jgi:hypothetical protein
MEARHENPFHGGDPRLPSQCVFCFRGNAFSVPRMGVWDGLRPLRPDLVVPHRVEEAVL